MLRSLLDDVLRLVGFGAGAVFAIQQGFKLLENGELFGAWTYFVAAALLVLAVCVLVYLIGQDLGALMPQRWYSGLILTFLVVLVTCIATAVVIRPVTDALFHEEPE